jgi:hypothetical protein
MNKTYKVKIIVNGKTVKVEYFNTVIKEELSKLENASRASKELDDNYFVSSYFIDNNTLSINLDTEFRTVGK